MRTYPVLFDPDSEAERRERIKENWKTYEKLIKGEKE
jgi:hypothetical protein